MFSLQTHFDIVSKDYKTLVAVSISLRFASEIEMGYDPLIEQSENHGGCFIYQFPAEKEGTKPRYFRTCKVIVEYRSLCIGGRMTRVWKAVEVDPITKADKSGVAVALKDVRLDHAASTERQIQGAIFKDIEAFAEKRHDHPIFTTLKKARKDMTDRLNAGLSDRKL